ncbi:MAG: hypothetical protein JWP31_1528 [Aeromicrobium sp.]|nr:hypothetical protein [Aeromicrobium sp.]
MTTELTAPREMTLHGLDLNLTGWFQIGWSDELEVGGVLAKHYFGKDLVVYRGLDGTVVVQDRHCRHLGASLAHGGCVVEGGIQCPFHGWVWAPDGANASIPYQDKPNRARRLGTYPSAELNEAIYMWNDPEGEEPTWDVAEATTYAPHAAEREFHRPGHDGQSQFTKLQIHPQMVAENAVDPHHFRFVHGTPISPVVLDEKVTDAAWWSRVGFGRRWSKELEAGGPISPDPSNTIEILFQGLGVSINTEKMPDGMRLIAINTTPVDDGESEIFATYWIEKQAGDIEDGSYERRLNEAKNSLPDDLNIWQHQIFLDPPAFGAGESRGFSRMRTWTRSFFPEDSDFLVSKRPSERPL